MLIHSYCLVFYSKESERKEKKLPVVIVWQTHTWLGEGNKEEEEKEEEKKKRRRSRGDEEEEKKKKNMLSCFKPVEKAVRHLSCQTLSAGSCQTVRVVGCQIGVGSCQTLF